MNKKVALLVRLEAKPGKRFKPRNGERPSGKNILVGYRERGH
jgi:hypothetical protein